MIIKHNFICEFDTYSIDIYLINIFDQFKCFKNFRAIHRSSQLNNRVTFRLRDNDIIFEIKITMMNKKIFLD